MSRRLTFLSYALSIGCAAAALLLFAAPRVTGQGNVGTLTLLSSEGRRALPLAINDNQEFVPLDDLAAAFQFTVRAESGAVTLQRGTATIILTPGQALVSAGAGRVVSLNPPPTRIAGRVMVPLDFINRALGPAAGIRLDVRRASRLVVIGDLVVPRVTIRHEATADSARLTIDATPRVASAVSQEGNRLIVRFTADALDATAPQLTTQNFVTGVRLQDATTVAIDLGPRFASYRSNTESTQTSTRLVIDLLSTRADAPVITGPGAPAPRPPVPSAPAAPSEIPELITRGPALTTLVIDPGHGGEDIGARGPGGALEKDVTLSVARRLKALVESRLGVRVLLTRDGDRSSPLERRTAVANNNKADVFLSLHVNASLVETARGASLHVATFDDAQQARSSVVSERVPTFSGSTRELELLPWDVAQIRHMSRSRELAEILAASLAGVTQMAARPVERGSFRVLESANMASVLIELGYLTNPEEETQLVSSAFQDQVAQALLDALIRYQQSLTPGGNDR